MPSLTKLDSRSFTSLSTLSSNNGSRRNVDPNQESVYRWIPKEDHVETKSTNTGVHYRSIYGPQSREEYKKARHAGKAATMGPAKVKPNEPTRFLKKHTGEKRFEQKNVHHHEQKIKTNNLPLWEPKYPKEVPVTIPEYPKRGQKKSSELECYKEKIDYGKVPDYLKTRKEDLERIEQAKRVLESQKVEIKNSTLNGLRKLTEKERKEILEGLNAKWKALTAEFQKLPLVIDTAPKITRKSALEKELKKVEADIEKFSHENILIYE